MKIGLDARVLNQNTKNLIEKIIQKDWLEEAKGAEELKFVLFFDSRVTNKEAKQFKEDNVEIKRFPFSRYRKFMRYAYSQILVSGFLLKERLDLLHATAGTLPLTYKGNILLNLWQKEESRKEKILQKRICKKAEKIIVSSGRLKGDLVKDYKIDKEKVKVLNKSSDSQVEDILEIYQEFLN